jgi:hypothetical protein
MLASTLKDCRYKGRLLLVSYHYYPHEVIESCHPRQGNLATIAQKAQNETDMGEWQLKVRAMTRFGIFRVPGSKIVNIFQDETGVIKKP